MSYGLRRGIVEEIISSTEYRVRIINYDSGIGDPSKTLTSDLPIATVMIQPGTNVSYNVGDRVYLGFNKDELSDPIIMGAMLTEDYLTGEDQIELPQVESAIEEIKESIGDLTVDQYYTHVKYSNDNGLTFTSLYKYNDLSNEELKERGFVKLIGQVSYVIDKDILISSESSSVYWSIIDKDSIDHSTKFMIDTTLRAGNGSIEEGTFVEAESRTFSDKIFDIPFSMRTYENIYLDFKIVFNIDYEDYHFVLTTDIDVIGSPQGDYLGICTSDSPIPPDDPIYYSWTSFKDTIEDIVGTVSNELENRVAANERVLYGSDDSCGLTEGISVTDNRIDLHGEDNKKIVFSTNESIYIDDTDDSYVSQTTKHAAKNVNRSFIDTITPSGHFTLYIREEE